jgi:hypothetical protein
VEALLRDQIARLAANPAARMTPLTIVVTPANIIIAAQKANQTVNAG